MTNGEPRQGWTFTPQIAVGLVIVAFGLLLTAGNLGYGNFHRALSFWPMVFTVAGVAILAERGCRGSRRTFGFVLVTIGLWWTADTAFGLGIYVDDWWPLLLVGGGVYLVYRAVKSGQHTGADSSTAAGSTLPGAGPASAGDFTGAAAASGGGEDMNAFAFMSGVKRNVFATSGAPASLTAVMAGIELDFRQAATATPETVVNLFVMWGGIVLRVPPDWQVVNELAPIMGGVDDRSGHTPPYRHRLVLKGIVIMGGVEVK